MNWAATGARAASIALADCSVCPAVPKSEFASAFDCFTDWPRAAWTLACDDWKLIAILTEIPTTAAPIPRKA